MLDVSVAKRLGTFQIEAAFAADGRVTALFGPSGAGKTSVVNMIAGLVVPDRGTIRLGDLILFDAERRISVPVHRRRIGYVFQDGRLLPHLTVRQNLRFGRWMNGVAPDAAQERRIVDLLGIGSLLPRRPAGLSGGEKQRVAIGRALFLKPRLLLLDEPLASLDAARRAEILPYLERLKSEAGVPMVLVSHAYAEISRLADTVVHMREGRVAGVEATASFGKADASVT